MVKKIQGPSTQSTKTTDAITKSLAIQTTKISASAKVSATTNQQGIHRTGNKINKRITQADKEHLFQLITEEADKMVDENIIPKKKKDTISKAVKMVIEASAESEQENN